MIDFQALLYDKIYATLGGPARLELADTNVKHVLTVIDKTAGIAESAQGHISRGAVNPGVIEVQTLRPAACVRVAELSAKGLNAADLENGHLTFSRDDGVTFTGTVWRIESTRPRPGPNGEASGELLLILIDEEPA